MSLLEVDIRQARGFSLRAREQERGERVEIGAEEARLWALAKKLFIVGRVYTGDEIILKIQGATGVDQERAARGFIRIGQAGALEPLPGDRYLFREPRPHAETEN